MQNHPFSREEINCSELLLLLAAKQNLIFNSSRKSDERHARPVFPSNIHLMYTYVHIGIIHGFLEFIRDFFIGLKTNFSFCM